MVDGVGGNDRDCLAVRVRLCDRHGPVSKERHGSLELPRHTLGAFGVEGERAVEAFRVLLIYSLGFAAFQAPRLQVDSSARTEQVAATFASLPEDRFPQLRRLAGHLAAPTTDRHFHTGLRWLLDGIAPQPAD